MNYYPNYKNHDGYDEDRDGSTHKCTRDVLFHEFGHFAGLAHVRYNNENTDDRDTNCTEWQKYTMTTVYQGDWFTDCRRETLSEEDKWALHTLYHGEP